MKLKNDEMIHLTINKELKEKLVNKARENGMPLTVYVRYLLLDLMNIEKEK